MGFEITLHKLTDFYTQKILSLCCPKGTEDGEPQEMGKSTQKINSRTKGAVGERQLAQLLREQGWTDARRGVQYSGLKGDADVVGVQGIHIECKRCQQVSDEKWLQQSERDARLGEIPVVIYRRNNEKWKVLIRQELANLIWQTLTTEQKQSIKDRLKFSY